MPKNEYPLEVSYWVDILPEEFEYGRDYQLHSSDYLGERTPVYEISNTGTSKNLESNSVTESNYRVIQNDETLQDKVAYGSSGHGYESIIVPADRQPSKEVLDIIAALESYPILDEMDHSELELEEESKDWEDYGRKDFIKNILLDTVLYYFETELKGEEGEIDIDDIKDILEDSDKIVDEIFYNYFRDYVEYSGESTHYNYEGMARMIDEMSVLAWKAKIIAPIIKIEEIDDLFAKPDNWMRPF